MRIISLFLLASVPSFRANSQVSSISLPPHPAPAVITAAEYLLDSDPSFGGGSPLSLSGGTNAGGSFSAAVPSLSAGVHQALFRAKDANGSWSLTNPRTLYVIIPNLDLPAGTAAAQAIQYVEYFFDADPGRGNGVPIPVSPGTTVSGSIGLDITALSAGAHRVFFRCRDAAGAWSLTSIRQMDILVQSVSLPAHPAPGLITALEYFFDTDPGWGNGTTVAVSPASTVSNLSLAANISALGAGPHTLFVRTLGQRSITSGYPFSIATPLPLRLLSMGAEKEAAHVRVRWKSATDDDIKSYTVERSTDGRHFAPAGSLAAAGAQENSYSLLDTAAGSLGAERLYYRIRSRLKTGTEVLSALMTLAWQSPGTLAGAFLYPNPATAEARLVFGAGLTGTVVVRLVDVSGRLLQLLRQPPDSGDNSFVLPLTDLPAGLYQVQVETEAERRSFRLMKQ